LEEKHRDQQTEGVNLSEDPEIEMQKIRLLSQKSIEIQDNNSFLSKIFLKKYRSRGIGCPRHGLIHDSYGLTTEELEIFEYNAAKKVQL
jgi:hypothetical protein